MAWPTDGFQSVEVDYDLDFSSEDVGIHVEFKRALAGSITVAHIDEIREELETRLNDFADWVDLTYSVSSIRETTYFGQIPTIGI